MLSHASRSNIGRPGRPLNAVPGSVVSAWIPAPLHDHLIQLANRKKQSVSVTVCQLLSSNLSDSPPPPAPEFNEEARRRLEVLLRRELFNFEVA